MKKILFILFAISLFACEKDEKNKEPVKVKKLVARYTEPDFFTLEGDTRYKFDLKKAESFHPDYVFSYKKDSTQIWINKERLESHVITDYFEEKTPPHLSYWILLNNSAFMAAIDKGDFVAYDYILRNQSWDPIRVSPFILEVYANVEE